MKSIWEARERNTKRMALIIAIMLHVLAFVVISVSTSDVSVRDMIEHVFGHNQSSQQATADAKT